MRLAILIVGGKSLLELLPLIAGLGVAGAGIALAMQGVLSNVAAGLTIIFTRPFRVGEYIAIVGEILHNYGKVRQVEVVVGVSYDTDVDAAKAVIHELLAANPRVMRDPAPETFVMVLADSSVNIAVRPWVSVTDYGALIGELNEAILAAFRGRGIEIPFPQREVRMLG